MKHFTLPSFWRHYRQLSEGVRILADKNWQLLAADPQHASLQLKKVGGARKLWSVRIGMHYRALALDKPEGAVGFWIGSHADYDSLLR